MLLERLRRETRAAHDRIERDAQLIARVESRDTYRRLLELFFGFYGAWEDAAEAIIAEPALFEGRRKMPLLRRDLAVLGVSDRRIAALPLCWPPVSMPTRAAAFGAMYVVEGSTLGGAIIAHHAEAALGIDKETGCAFFRSYEGDLHRMWIDFGARLLEVSSPDHDDLIVASAIGAFETMRNWLCQQPSEI